MLEQFNLPRKSGERQERLKKYAIVAKEELKWYAMQTMDRLCGRDR